MKEKRALQVVFAVFVFLVMFEVKGSWLFDPDEARYAEIPREMLVTKDYVTPQLNGSHYFEKPPLLYWLNAASFKIFGETPYAARMAARAAGIGTALLLLFLLPLKRGSLVGWWAALIYLSAPLAFSHSRINLTDGPLTFGMTLTFLALLRLIHAVDSGEKTLKWNLALGLGAAIAVLSKGPVGIVLPGFVFLIWVISEKKWELLKIVGISPAPILFLILTVPWFYLVERANPGFAWFFFIHEHVLRYATHEAMRQEAPYFFLITFVWGFLPWLDPFYRSVQSFFRRANLRDHSDTHFLVIWFFVILIFFSFSQSKLIPYLLPAIPAAAGLAAQWIVKDERKKYGWWKLQLFLWMIMVPVGLATGFHSGFLERYNITKHAGFLGIFVLSGAWLSAWLSHRSGKRALLAQITSWAALYLVLIFSIDNVAHEYSEHALAETALGLKGTTVVMYRCYLQSFPWEFKHPIPVVQFHGELASDNQMSPELFWDSQKFWTRWRSTERMVVGLHLSDLAEFQTKSAGTEIIINKNRRSALVANFH